MNSSVRSVADSTSVCGQLLAATCWQSYSLDADSIGFCSIPNILRTLPSIISQLQAISAFPCHPVVRPAWSDAVLVKRLLDAGAQSLLFPNIQTADEARAAVSFTRYPPTGIRGVAGGSRAASYGLNAEYLRSADNEICVLVQIETEVALKNIRDIAAVDGVDGIFIGPADLAASLGHLITYRIFRTFRIDGFFINRRSNQ